MIYFLSLLSHATKVTLIPKLTENVNIQMIGLVDASPNFLNSQLLINQLQNSHGLQQYVHHYYEKDQVTMHPENTRYA